MKKSKLLVIGQVWPEPTSSAAGWRMLELIQLFIDNGMEVTFASAAGKSEFSYDLDKIGVISRDIRLNDKSFDDFLISLGPDIVMFDRFMVEEQYGWRVAEQCPDAVRILDTEDLHFLRRARQDAFKQNLEWCDELMYSEAAKREVAAIYRCDLSIIISKSEIEILQTKFNVSAELLYYLPFFYQEGEFTLSKKNWKSFDERQDFVFIGNFLHEPNWNTVQLLKSEIWPRIRKKIPKANLHIYGAYESQKVSQLHQPKEGFHIKGRANNAKETLGNYKILLAPIPYGAGLKGKFVDAMFAGTPSVTTDVGAEGMRGGDWPGFIERNHQKFVETAVNLYNQRGLWESKQRLITKIMRKIFADENIQKGFMEKIQSLQDDLSGHRRSNFIGQIFLTEMMQSYKYMSRWIEEKNRTRN